MNIEIANRLVQLRKKNGFSQEELAARLGISRQAVSKWERAESSPDTDNLILLARLYHISLDDLLKTDDPVKSAQNTAQSEAPNWASTVPPSDPVDNVQPETSEFSPALQNFIAAAPLLAALLLQLLFIVIPPLNSLAESFFSPATALIYLILGCCFHLWHPGWLVFFMIPAFYAGITGAYPILVTILFLLLGFYRDKWHPAWILFTTIPIFYKLADYLHF
ncbi:helix-turn-helix domain-containing protein [Caproicibacterium sp. XB2]|uniref:helix-turn-helix domain-containing protein n=1 Tax=Caproicibacterium sp. XB2 TaxID=3388458 RepID=UPI00384BC491